MKKKLAHVLLSSTSLIISLVAFVISGNHFQQLRGGSGADEYLATFLFMALSAMCCIFSGYSLLYPEEAKFPFEESDYEPISQGKIINEDFPADGKRYIKLPYDWQEDVWLRLPYDWAIDEDELK